MPVTGGNTIRRRMRSIQRNVNDAIAATMDELADELLKDSRDLAPQLTGEMIRTAGTDKQDARRRGVFRRSVFYTVDYAIYQHEGIARVGHASGRSGASSGGFLQPGPITRAKPGAGRKFLQRPFDAKKRDMIVQVSRATERAIRLSVR